MVMDENWDMEIEDENEDLMGNPFDVENAYDAMVFPISPLSKAGQKNLRHAQRSMRHEVRKQHEKKKNRRRTLEIFQEQFAADAGQSGASLLMIDEDDDDLMKRTASAKKPRFSSFKSSIFPKRSSPQFLRMPQLPVSRLVLPTKLKTPAKTPLKRSFVDEKAVMAKRLQLTNNSFLPTTPSLKSPGKSRIPVRQAV
ncbi:Aste57867_14037 [Aphanomyces stellatus]|uniref:Aste57867_14037 protein n=1 Tax=Aphanomyces stellatus TaxID=120398 RepID=A0A485L0K4_9STRA|nr:hypothetical protein As57867_013986 [Aphanomyces stellatus]VFT90867.1 Aste57867_14037 [Aphanomyces stellatus]